MNIPDLSAFAANIHAERKMLEGIEVAMKKQNVAGYPIGMPMQAAEGMAFNQACEAGYIRMVNIRTVMGQVAPNQQPAAMAIATYMLTREGAARLHELRERERLSKVQQ